MPNQRKVSVIGLGYVGLTIANEFGQSERVIGLDKSKARISELKKGSDKNHEVSSNSLKKANIHYTTNPRDLKKANFHIIAVPTPINDGKFPDLSILIAASEMVGKQLKKGDIVVYESTVYPGTTEEKCIPALERASSLVCGKDFSVGYSPERVNPSDKEHVLSNIPKIVSGIDQPTLNVIADVYRAIVKAGVYPVSCIRVAEATKVIENTQRDVNISLMNEIALILHSIGMDSAEVLAAARTKWNFLPFRPGLVGGHCVGVNAYYLAYKAEQAGYHPDVILASRRINDYMPKFLAENVIKALNHMGVTIKNAKIAILGLTYKENCSDIHDTKTVDLINELKTYDAKVLVHDPLADPAITKKELGIDLVSFKKIKNMDVIILMVAHQEYVKLESYQLEAMLKKKGLIMDVKGILKSEDFAGTGHMLWRL